MLINTTYVLLIQHMFINTTYVLLIQHMFINTAYVLIELNLNSTVEV